MKGYVASILQDSEGAQSLEKAFPDVDPGIRPFGTRVLVQIRISPRKSKGGVELTDESRETEKWNTQIAKVIELGPVAFCNRETLETWPEGQWCEVGTFVRVPKYGGDRWEVPLGSGNDDDSALFVIFNDLDVIGQVTTDPRLIKAYI